MAIDDPKVGPLTALVLALAEESIEALQAAHEQFFEDGDSEATKAVSAKLERMCMLQSLVEMSVRESIDQKETQTDTVAEISKYLQANDPEVFPFSLQTQADGGILLLDTRIGILPATSEWLDEHYPGKIVITKTARAENMERGGTANNNATAGYQAKDETRFVSMPPPQINSGMPMEGGLPQGLPGGKLGDR